MAEQKKIPLPYLMAGLYRAKFSGKLRLVEGDVERTIVLSDGLPMQVQSRSQQETLGHLLLQEGRIDSKQYDQMLKDMISSGKPAGEVLIELGILSPHEVFSALEFQTRKKLSNSFRMVDFEFSIIHEEIPLDLLISKVDMAETIISGILSCYSVDRILDEFPADEEMVFMVVESERQRTKLALKELKLLRSLGTGTSLSKIMASETDLKYLLSVLYTFHALGVVEASGLDRPTHPEFEVGKTQPSKKPYPKPKVEEKSMEEEFRPPTLDNILQRRINSALAQKVLKMGREDHFSLLEVDKTATEKELKEAYSKLVSTYGLSDIEKTYSSSQEQELAQRLLERANGALGILTRETSRRTYSESLKKDDRKKAKTSNRILADMHAHKAIEAIQMENWDEAVAWLEQAISLYPKEPSYHFQLGRAGYLRAIATTPKEQKLDERLKDPLLKAVRLDSHYDQPRLYLGYIAKRNGDYVQAMIEIQKAIDCNPHNKLARSELKLLRRRMREREKA